MVGGEDEVDPLDVSASHIGPPTPYRFFLLLEASLETTGSENQVHALLPSSRMLIKQSVFFNHGVK